MSVCVCEKHEAVCQTFSQQLTRLSRLSVQIMQAESVILLDSPLRFDMTSSVHFATLRHLCLIDSDIDLGMLIDALHLMGNLVKLYINNKNRFAESERR